MADTFSVKVNAPDRSPLRTLPDHDVAPSET